MRPALSHPRPRHLVWRRGHPAAASHGHSRPADHATLTVAERACRTADWLDPTRVSRPCGGVGGKAPPSSVGELRDLLQPGAHAPCARQGCSAPSTCADSRAYRISHLARRSPSALHSDGIIGTHNYFRVVERLGEPKQELDAARKGDGHECGEARRTDPPRPFPHDPSVRHERPLAAFPPAPRRDQAWLFPLTAHITQMPLVEPSEALA